MKVTAKEPFKLNGKDVAKGATVDLPGTLARRYIEAGIAVQDKGEKAAQDAQAAAETDAPTIRATAAAAAEPASKPAPKK